MPGPYDTYIAYGQGWANVSNTPHREYKHWVHEGGISTPLIVHWPSAIKRRGELVRTPEPGPCEKFSVHVLGRDEVKRRLHGGRFADGFTALALFYYFARIAGP